MSTYMYLADSSNNTWQVSVNDSGELLTVSKAGNAVVPVIKDFQTGLTAWQLGISTIGQLQTINISMQPSLINEIPFLSTPSNILYGLSILPSGIIVTNKIAAITVSSIISFIQSILNDSAGYTWNFNNLLSFLQMAYQDLSVLLQLTQIPISRQEEVILSLPSNTQVIALGTNPALPANLITPTYLEERWTGQDDSYWTPMEQRNFSVDDIQDTYLNYWWWDGYQINFLGSTSAEDVKIRYDSSLWLPQSQSDYVLPRGTELFLEHQTAHYAADSIYDEYKSKQEFQKAEMAIEKYLRYQVKTQQNMPVRRKGYRSRTLSNYR